LDQNPGDLEIRERGHILTETSAYKAIDRHAGRTLLSKPVVFG
jgi:hypothetical protein